MEDDIIYCKTDNKNNAGITTALWAFKSTLGNPISRAILRGSLTPYEINGRNYPALYWALGAYAGEKLDYPLSLWLPIQIVSTLMKLGITLANGNEEQVKEAVLRDPHIRRGICLVLEGIAKYGITVPQRLPSPFLIVWNFTNSCNLKCKHCYQQASGPLENELSLEEKLDLVNQLDAAGVAAVALSGGEPTIHPHFKRIIQELSSRGIFTSVATNGWIFSNIERLKEARDLGLQYIEVSVDSSRPEKHDEFRGIPGAWDHAIAALRNSVEIGMMQGMATLMSKDTLGEIDDILDLAEDIGITKVIFFNFIPTGRAKGIMERDLTPDEREVFMKELYREMGRRKIEVLTTAPQYARICLLVEGGPVSPAHFYAGGNYAAKTLAEFVGGCGAGRIYAGIQPDGFVIPCVFMPIPVGNIRERSFRDIWDNSREFNLLRNRDNFTGHCRNCEYRNFCGGCRARAYYYNSSLLEDDPGCIRNNGKKVPIS
ncbi:MAG: radical SAM protein [Methanotrichaceae archaeon]